MSARTRWCCPTGAHPAVLAPSRPRRDDVRRYCLRCSEKSGRLVERVAPALEAKRASADDKRKARAATKRERERAHEDAYYRVGDVDLRAVVASLYRLPVAREWRTRRHLAEQPPELTVRRTRTGARRLGFAAPHKHSISVTIYVGTTQRERPDGTLGPSEPLRDDEIAAPISTLIHEVAHILVGGDRAGNWHGPKFRACEARLTEQWNARTDAAHRVAGSVGRKLTIVRGFDSTTSSSLKTL